MPSSPATRPKRGRPAAASREDVLAAAAHRYLRGRRVDVQAIAAELGLGRSTIYRWFGTRDDLLGEVIVRAAKPLLDDACAKASGRGAERLLDIFDRFNRSLAQAPALLAFVESERAAAVRTIISGDGRVQPEMVAMIVAVIEEEIATHGYRPRLDPETLGYAVVRLAEAFLFNDAWAGMRADVDRLKQVQAALLGVSAEPADSPAAGA